GPPGGEFFTPVLLTGDAVAGSTVKWPDWRSLRVHDSGVVAALVELEDGGWAVVAGEPGALRVALHDGQVLDDGAVIRDIILHYDEFGPYGHELPVLLADDGSVRAAVQVWDAA